MRLTLTMRSYFSYFCLRFSDLVYHVSQMILIRIYHFFYGSSILNNLNSKLYIISTCLYSNKWLHHANQEYYHPSLFLSPMSFWM